MRLSLQQKIWLYTLGPLVLLLVTTLFVVHRQVQRRDHQNIHRDLAMASENLQEWIVARQRDLSTMAYVISRDPKFFAMLTIPRDERGEDFAGTLQALALDFHRVAGRDLFDILDESGRVIARATTGERLGEDLSSAAGVRDALAGRSSSGVFVDGGAPYLVAYVPILVAGEIAGVLRLGEAVNAGLAARLKAMTRSEVSFFLGPEIVTTTIRGRDASSILAATLHEAGIAFDAGGPRESITIGEESYATYLAQIETTLAPQRFGFVLQRSLAEELVFLKSMRKTIAVTGCLILIVVIGAGLVTARGITRPIKGIVRAAQEMERGNYDCPVDASTGDEIEYLAKRFTGMRESMRGNIARLEDLDRMKSNFISIASHELRTPVAALQGFLYVLRDPAFGALSAQQTELLDDVSESMETLSRVVQQVTDMSLLDRKRLALAPSSTEVRGLVEEVVSAVSSAQRSPRRLRVSVTVAPGIPDVLVDRERLAQALTNVVANAFRFTPDGGEVAIAATPRADALEIAVRDTGVGIPPAEFDRVFERIYECGNVYHHSSGTTEFGSSGLGLGLPIAKGIVEAHGGRISLDSVLGQGSVFTITLPWERIRGQGGPASPGAPERPSEHAKDAGSRSVRGTFEEVHS